MQRSHTLRLRYGVPVLAALLGLAPWAAAPRAAAQPAGWNPQAMVAPAKAVEAAASALLETLRVVVIPAHTMDRQQMLGDVASDTQTIQNTSRYLSGKLDGGISYKHVQKAVHRISQDFQDLKSNANFLAAPERFNQGVSQLGTAVHTLERQFASGG